MYKNILVIGASGFIGRNLVIFLAKKNINVLCISRSEKNDKFNEFKNVSYYQIDISDIDSLNIKKKIDVVINLAWSFTSGEKRANFYLQNKNVENNIKVLNFCQRNNVKKYIGSGTIMEDELYFSLNSSYSNSNLIYSLSKYNDHVLSKIKTNILNIDFVWMKFVNIYGPDEISKRFIFNVVKNILLNKHNKFSFGNQLYDFLYIDDALEAIWLIINNSKKNDEFIISSQKPRKLKYWIRDIYKFLECKDLIFDELENGGIFLKKEYFICSNLLNLNFKPKMNFKKGIQKTKKFIQTTLIKVK